MFKIGNFKTLDKDLIRTIKIKSTYKSYPKKFIY